MIYVYREKSKSAQALYEAIKDEGSQVTRLRRVGDASPKKGDLVVNWGACIDWPYWPGVTILNKHPLGDKLAEIQRLHKAGVPCFEFRTTKPATGTWLARRRMHYEGNDLLNEGYGDFWTRKENIKKELRFHVFKGKVIQTQFKKAVKENAHPWIRSWATGWDWKNGGDTTPAMYKAAVEAVEACGLDMGAVDIGIMDGHNEFVVIEVNTAPGFDVGGVTCYKWANAIIEVNTE